jgi:hypothetical protein
MVDVDGPGLGSRDRAWAWRSRDEGLPMHNSNSNSPFYGQPVVPFDRYFWLPLRNILDVRTQKGLFAVCYLLLTP